MTPILVADAVCKAFEDGRQRRRVLEGLSFSLHAGEVIALCGPSGSGKTTLLNLAAGLLRPDAGTLRLHGNGRPVELGSLADDALTRVRRAQIGYVFQFFNLVPTLTVRENVLLPLELNRRADLTARAIARLDGLGLADRHHAFPEQLSGGERQRVAIARALAHEPRLVLADEPTGNLDAVNARGVAELLWREVRALGSGLLIATHDEAIARGADRVQRFGA